MEETSKDIPSPEEHARRLAWLAEYAARLDALLRLPDPR